MDDSFASLIDNPTETAVGDYLYRGACQETHFPFLGCSVIDGITVKADGNESTLICP